MEPIEVAVEEKPEDFAIMEDVVEAAPVEVPTPFATCDFLLDTTPELGTPNFGRAVPSPHTRLPSEAEPKETSRVQVGSGWNKGDRDQAVNSTIGRVLPNFVRATTKSTQS